MKMKAIMLLIFAVFLAATSFCFGQKTHVLFADSIGNSQTKIGYINLEQYEPYESVAVSVYAMGEIDLDSLDVQGGIYLKNLDYKGSVVEGLNLYEALKGATLTVNNIDGTATYIQGSLTITKAEAKGYNRLKVTLTAAATGNDGTDTAQKGMVLFTVYK